MECECVHILYHIKTTTNNNNITGSISKMMTCVYVYKYKVLSSPPPPYTLKSVFDV